MKTKKEIIENLIREGSIGLDDALILLEEDKEQHAIYVPYIPYYPYPTWPQNPWFEINPNGTQYEFSIFNTTPTIVPDIN